MNDINLTYDYNATANNNIESFLWNFAFPGIILHEIAHVLAATITFTKIKAVHLLIWNKQTKTVGGKVELHETNSFQALITGIAPFVLLTFFGIFAYY